MDDQQGLQTIPKFASFRPPATSARHHHSIENSSSKPRERRGNEGEPAIDGRSRPDATNTKVSRHERAIAEPPQRSRLESNAPRPSQSEDSFIFDGMGDEGNLRYGKLHQYDIPMYRRSAFGSVLGLHKRQKITFRGSDIVMSDGRGDGIAKRDLMTLPRIGNGKELRIRQINSVDLDGNADFVKLSDREGRQATRNPLHSPQLATLSVEDSDVNYRSIDGKAKAPPGPEDSDLEFDEELSYEDGRNLENSNFDIPSIGTRLAKDVELRPTDGKAWLALINHQDVLASQRSTAGRMTSAERLSMADIKLSMYEKARKLVEDEIFTDILILGMLEEGSKIWGSSKLANQWKIILHDYPTHVVLWTQYLDFRQTAFASFRLHELREVFNECLQLTRRPDLPSTISNERCLSDIQLYIILRYAGSLHEGGFVEYSTAVWQALFEYNLCRPLLRKDDPKPLHIKLSASFEDFWDSEVARTGEESAQGWAQFSEYGGDPPAPVVEQTSEIVQDLQLWARNEGQNDKRNVLPARTMDEIGEDDPYRVVLMPDIQSILFDFTVPSDVEGLTDGFLAFCHLPPPQNLREIHRYWWRDAFIRNDGTYTSDSSPADRISDLSNMSTGADALEERSCHATLKKSADDMVFLQTTTESLFAPRTSFWSSFPPGLYADHETHKHRLTWIRRMLRSLVDSGRTGEAVAEYYLAFEFHFFPTTVEKTARAILKKAKTSARLYNAFSLIQFRMGKVDMANTTFATAISMLSGQHLPVRRQSALLWRTWIWGILELHGREMALARFLTFCDPQIVPTTPSRETLDLATNALALLQVQRALGDGRDSSLAQQDVANLILYVDLLVLLAYVSSSLEVALATFDKNCAMIPISTELRAQVLERFHQNRARLLYHHVSHSRSFKPALMRFALGESIALFPENTLFLSLYAWNEARFRIDDRVRTIITDVLSRGSPIGASAAVLPQRASVIPHFFAIATELSRGTALGSNSHTIRSTFEQCLESDGAKSSAMLWKMYMLWELGHREKRRAKQVFYRAVRACPWVKDLYMLAFQHLGDDMSWQELRAVYEMVVEKELRLHVSLDDYFAALEEGMASKGKFR